MARIQTNSFTLAISFAVFLSVVPLAKQSQAQLKSVGKSCLSNERKSIDQIDHSVFDALLKKYVDSDGQVNYSAWKSSTNDRLALQNYLASLSKADPDRQCSRNAKLAYWINAYNAVTLEGILEVYPTSSIRNHTKKLGYNLWKDLKLIVADKRINLDDIEHKILRKMNEPRIHFAIVCASIGCPRLLNEAYAPGKLESQLVKNTRDFFSRKRNLNFDSSKSELQLSAILKWFGSDFGSDTQAQLRAVAGYFPEAIQSAIQRGGFSVSYLDYDWNLNEQR